MIFEEKMDCLKDVLETMCLQMACCQICDFFERGDNDGDYFMCGIKDNQGKVPCLNGWNMEEAPELKENYKYMFPESIRESIVNHFTRCV